MAHPIVDFFFSPYPTAQELRLRAAIADGLAHVSRIEPLDPLPGESVTLLFSAQAQLPIKHVAVYYTTDGTEPVGERGHARSGNVVMAEVDEITQETQQGLTVQHWRATIPAQPDNVLVRYRVDGWNEQDGHWLADNVEPVGIMPLHGRVFAYHVDRWTTPQWWYDAVVYHIYVDRFNAGLAEPKLLDYDQSVITGFFGGTLQGILEKLDYIQALGVNCIWLSPLFESPSAHGYDASDYFTVAGRYGTNEALRRLTSEAHKRGMRVLFDFAGNHTSNEHAAFVDALAHPDSPHAEWYMSNTLGSYRTYASGGTMPELRTDSAAVQRYLFDVVNYWLSDLGADGLRLDYVPGPSHTFWTLFQQNIKTNFPNAVTLGEITGSLSEIATYAGRIDAFMDFPLTHLLRETFALRSLPLANMLDLLDERQLPPNMGSATLLDNHDMHRFLWLADGKKERLKLAAVCHMTLEGTPIVYYGTEVGLSQYDDAHKENALARAPMLWDERQDTNLLALYQQLIALRNSHAALRHGKRIPLALEVQGEAIQKEQVGGYLRVLGEERIIVLLNNSDKATHIRIPLRETFIPKGAKHSAITFQHLLTLGDVSSDDASVMQNSMSEISLAPFGAFVAAVLVGVVM